VLAAFAAPSVRPPVHAGDPNVNDAIADQERLEAALAEHRARLAALRREQTELTSSIAALTDDLDQAGVQLDEAQAELDRLTRMLDQSRADLERYRTQIATLESDLQVIAADITQTRKDLSARELLLQEHLRAAYEQSQTSILEVLLSTDSFGQASSQLSYLLTLSDEDRALAEEIRHTREQLQVRRDTLRDGRETMTVLRDAEAERAASLAAQQAEVDAAKQRLEEYRAKLEALRKEQEAQYAAAVRNARTTQEVVAAEEQKLAGQRELVERLKEEADKLDIAYRGRFAWPLHGDFLVTQEFGRTSFNPKHTGIDMAYYTPSCGGPIYAAADGVVLADGRPNIAYGDTAIGVVIGHSQRLQTWYWHLSREGVSVGQQVSVGDLIGYEGATGYATGCHLHFEVRFDGQPVNPRNYLP
jgi:murein DD-endopeptidase MepM/ murein hydrolase activator NlpD